MKAKTKRKRENKNKHEINESVSNKKANQLLNETNKQKNKQVLGNVLDFRSKKYHEKSTSLFEAPSRLILKWKRNVLTKR